MEAPALYSTIKDFLGPKFLSWTPDERKDTIELKTGKRLNRQVQNMIEALVTLKVTDSPWKDHAIFEKIVWALNEHIPNMFLMEKPPSHYVAYTLCIMSSMTNEFSEDVKKYVAAILADEGMCYAPNVLSLCQEYLNRFVENKNLIDKVKDSWEKMENSKFDSITFDDNDPIQGQLKKIAIIDLYLRRKETKLKEELK